MKKILNVCCTLILIVNVQAQKTTIVKDSFFVKGNCSMCKKTIETATKKAGASTAFWDETTKQIMITYNSNITSTLKIQKAIAKVGYDNKGVKATESSYNKLHCCCKYDRESN